MGEPRFVPVGRIARSHGVHGAVKIFPYGETLFSMAPGEVCYLRSRSTAPAVPLVIVSLRRQGRYLVVEFDGITERESVGALSGRELFVPEDRIEPPGAGEYYYYQLIGLDVETRDGVKLGVLRSILETGSADIYVVDREGVEFLVPAIEDVICEVDLERNKMVVDPPEGLLDDL